MPTSTQGVIWNSLDPAVLADPYPIYKALRESDPYHYSEATAQYLISQHEDVNKALRDWKRFSNRRIGEQPVTLERDLSILVHDPTTTRDCAVWSVRRSRLAASQRWMNTSARSRTPSWTRLTIWISST